MQGGILSDELALAVIQGLAPERGSSLPASAASLW